MQEQLTKPLSVWKGVFILSIASLFTKVLSAAYRIPYQNMTGDLGFYVYQQIYPLYGIVAMLAMYGFPVVLSQHRASLLAQGKSTEARQMISVLFYGLLLLVVVIWCFIYALADTIAVIMGDPQLAAPIRAMSYVLLLLPFLSISRGYHQSTGDLMPTTVSHVSEQFVRVSLILGFTYFFISSGLDAYVIGSGAAYGSFFGGLSGVIMLIIITKGEWVKELMDPRLLPLSKVYQLNKRLFKQSGFICLSALVLILFQLFDALSMIRLLQVHGFDTATSILAKGVYDRGQPLIQLGTILTTTFSLALVPMLSKAVAMKNVILAEQYQYFSYRLAFIIGGAATIGLMVIIEPTNQMLFTNVLGSDVLRVMAIAIGFSSLFVTLTAVMQGYNLARYPARAVGCGLLVKGLGNLILIPFYGTIGAAWSTVLALIIMVVYVVMAMHLNGQLYIGEYKTYVRIILTLFLIGMVTWLWKTGLMYVINDSSREMATILALTTVGIGSITAAICLLVFPIFTNEEWNFIPKLGRIRKSLLNKIRF